MTTNERNPPITGNSPDTLQRLALVAVLVLAVMTTVSTGPAFASNDNVLGECVREAAIASGITTAVLWMIVPGVGFFASVAGGLAGMGPMSLFSGCAAQLIG